jgi:hypothetical protein
MKAWKNPKNMPIFNALLILGFLIVSPLVIETEKESIANPIAMIKIVAASIGHHFYAATLFRLTTI